MHGRRLLLGTTVLLLPMNAWAQQNPAPNSINEFPDKLTGNIGIVSDYIFRGISQTKEKPALQGGVDYIHPGGFYLGVWGSNIDFSDEDHAHIEMDGYWIVWPVLTWQGMPG